MANNEEKLIYYTPEMILATDYYQFPKWLLGAKIDNDCRVLYMLLLDRYKLSLKNDWIDENNRVYSYFSKESAANILNISVASIYRSFKVLVENGFIEQVRQGQGKNNRIYLKSVDFKGYSQTYQIERSKNDDTEYRPQTYQNDMSKSINTRGQDLSNLEGNINKENINELSKFVVKQKPVKYDFEIREKAATYFDETILSSERYKAFQEADDTLTINKATLSLIKLLKEQNTSKVEKSLKLSQKQIIDLVNDVMNVQLNMYNSFDNPDGYIVSRLNKALEKV